VTVATNDGLSSAERRPIEVTHKRPFLVLRRRRLCHWPMRGKACEDKRTTRRVGDSASARHEKTYVFGKPKTTTPRAASE